MAKVTGPLFSVGARNKFAGALVYFPWKGLNVVRELVKPSQPREPAVMNVRLKMKSLGKVSNAFSPTSSLSDAIREKTPSGSVWNADWIGVAIKQFQNTNAKYDALATEYDAHLAKVDLASCASGIGLADEILCVEGKCADHPSTYGGGLAVYSLAKACYYRGVLDESAVPYTDPAGWDAGAITSFCARITD